jgi:hypothetical protein
MENIYINEKRKSIINSIQFIIVENLITPELWLKNCRSRSPTPANASEVLGVVLAATSTSRTPTPTTAIERAVISKIIVTQSQPSSSSSSTVTSANKANFSSENNSSSSKKPLINVLPSSKLLSRNLLHQKNLRKRARISGRITQHHLSSSSKQSISAQNNVSFSSSSDVRKQQQHQQQQNHHQQQKQRQSQHSPNPVASSGNFNRPPPLKFLQRPPINLFKFRPPFHNFIPQGLRMPPPPPENQNHPMNSLLPPPVVLVPHPVVLPIIIPVPLPLSAFWNAYQVGKNPSSSKITSTTPPSSCSSSEIDNENRRGHNKNETAAVEMSEEQPLDYTTSKSPESNDHKSPSLRDDNDVDDIDDDDVDDDDEAMMENGIESTTCDDDKMETSSNGNNLEKIAEFKITRQTLKRSHDNEPSTTSTFLRDYVNESNRPLRKRKIIPELTEVDNLSESP